MKMLSRHQIGTAGCRGIAKFGVVLAIPKWFAVPI